MEREHCSVDVAPGGYIVVTANPGAFQISLNFQSSTDAFQRQSVVLV